MDRGFPEEARSREGLRRLIRLLVHRDEAVRGCAGRALAAVTGAIAAVPPAAVRPGAGRHRTAPGMTGMTVTEDERRRRYCRRGNHRHKHARYPRTALILSQ